MRSQTLPIAKRLAAQPDGFSNGDFALAAGLSPNNAGARLATYVNAGHLFRAKSEGKHSRFFDSQERAEAFAQANEKPQAVSNVPAALIARMVADQLRTRRAEEATAGRKVMSNFALAEICKVSPAALDAALDPLVGVGKLTRMSVLRSGTAQFDYRYSATWVPCEADFALCNGESTPPKASVSPVAPPAPTPAPMAPVRAAKPPAPFLRHLRGDLEETQRTGGDNKMAGMAMERAFSQPGALGWGVDSESTADLTSDLPAAPLDLEADDLVCAFNSLGEMVLDLGNDVLVRVKPKAALALTRFAVGCLPVLEGMALRGEL